MPLEKRLTRCSSSSSSSGGSRCLHFGQLARSQRQTRQKTRTACHATADTLQCLRSDAAARRKGGPEKITQIMLFTQEDQPLQERDYSVWHSDSPTRRTLQMLFLGWHRQVELEFSRKFFLRVESVREVDATDAAVGVNLRQKE
jgi:hypothetical protein